MISDLEASGNTNAKVDKRKTDLGVQGPRRSPSPVLRPMTPQSRSGQPMISTRPRSRTPSPRPHARSPSPMPHAQSTSPASRPIGQNYFPSPHIPSRPLSPGLPLFLTQPNFPAVASPPALPQPRYQSRSLTPSPLPHGPIAIPSSTSSSGLYSGDPTSDYRRKFSAESSHRIQQNSAQYGRKFSLPTLGQKITHSSLDFYDEHIYAVPLNSDGLPFSDCSSDSDSDESYITMTPIPPTRKESLELLQNQATVSPRKLSLGIPLAHQQLASSAVEQRRRGESLAPLSSSWSQFQLPRRENSTSPPERNLPLMDGTIDRVSNVYEQRQAGNQSTKNSLIPADWSPTYVEISSTVLDGMRHTNDVSSDNTERIHHPTNRRRVTSPQPKRRHPPQAPRIPRHASNNQLDASPSQEKSRSQSKLGLKRSGSSSVPNLSNELEGEDESAPRKLEKSKNLAYSNGSLFSAYDSQAALSMVSPIIHCTSSSSSISSTNSGSWGSINQIGSVERPKPVSTFVLHEHHV